MSNILQIAKEDLRGLFKNAICAIITVGLIFTPSIFAWFNIIACWDVFNNTGNLKVAVASQDEGYQSDLIPIEINVGDQVISALRANEDIDWVFTDTDDAIDGAAAGRYYAAVVLPASFSRDMITFYSDETSNADIVYYANEKKSAIAPKITDKGADSISYKVNQVFTETISDIALGLAESLVNYIDDASTSEAIAKISTHMNSVASNLDNSASVISLYGSVISSAQSLASSTSDLATQGSTATSQAAQKIAEGADDITTFANNLSTSVDELKNSVEDAKSKLNAAKGEIDEVLDKGENSLPEIQQTLDTLVTNGTERIRKQATALLTLSESMQTTAEAIQDSAPETAAKLVALANELDTCAASLEDVATRLETGQANINAGLEGLVSFRASLNELITKANTNLDALSGKLNSDLTQALNEVVALSKNFAEGADEIAGKLKTESGNLDSTLQDVDSTLAAANAKINDFASKLHSSANNLREASSSIADALQTNDSSALKELLQSDTVGLATALSAPVGVERTALYPSENFGSGMAPLYTTLALFIGCLLIMVVVKPTVSRATQLKLKRPPHWQLFLGRYITVVLLALAQATIMGLGNILAVKVQAVHPLLLMVCFWVTAIVFSFIIYTLVASFANLGKAIAVLMLIVQVTGCGGSYPLQLLPSFVQTLSPFLPATHVVNAMRAAMFGVYNNDFWMSIGALALFILPFALVGLVLARPLARFMHWYIARVDASKLIS